MAKTAKAAPITGAVFKPVRIGQFDVPSIIISTEDAAGLKPGQRVQFIPSNGVIYEGEVGSVITDQVFFKDGVKPI